jgi:hypothetical protein
MLAEVLCSVSRDKNSRRCLGVGKRAWAKTQWENPEYHWPAINDSIKHFSGAAALARIIATSEIKAW